MLVIFNHGRDSGPDGAKIRALSGVASKLGCTCEAIDYRDLRDDAVGRARRLCGIIERLEHPPVLVGSSLGGWVVVHAAEQHDVAGLFLLAPALYLEDRVPGGRVPERYAPKTGRIAVVHGWKDEIIPWQNSARFANDAGAALHLVPDGHRLAHSIPVIERLFGMFLEELQADRS